MVRKRASTASVVVDVGAQILRGAEKVGDSLAHLPMVPKTRRGRVLARSILVSFCLVFAWISVIVGLQLRGQRPPDFRPRAEALLIELRDGRAAQVHDEASTSFRMVVREDTFVANMEDLNRTLGKFKEITAVVATETNRGPGGRTGRVDLRLEFERAATKGSISFRWEKNTWLLLGLSIEVPDALAEEASSIQARQDRVTGKVKEFAPIVTSILVRAFNGQVEEVWKETAPGFQQLEAFRGTVDGWVRTLGRFTRMLSATDPRLDPSYTSASFEGVFEFEKETVRGSFQFIKIDGAWRMFGVKLVTPLPRAGDGLPP